MILYITEWRASKQNMITILLAFNQLYLTAGVVYVILSNMSIQFYL